MTRTLRGAWSRRGTLLPLLLLTVVVVAGSVGVLGFAEAAGTSRLLAVPLLLLGAVALPATGRELAAARRTEIALARLRGIEGGELGVLLAAEPLLVLVLGGAVGTGLGALVAQLAADAWLEAPGRVIGVESVTVTAVVLLVALVAVLVGMAGALREPLADQLRGQSRPRLASVAAAFGHVLVIVGAVVAAYRSHVGDGTEPDLVVLAGPALFGLAVGQLGLWLLRRGALLAVRFGSGRALPGFLAARRLARVADAAASVRLLVAAGVVAGLAVTASTQVDAWTEETARLQAGGPLRIDLPDADAGDALTLTRQVDPDGDYLMAAVLVPGQGSVTARRSFLDTSRFAAVLGDFYDGTSAAALTRLDDRLTEGQGGAGEAATGDSVEVAVHGVSRRLSGTLRPRVMLTLREESGKRQRAGVQLDVPASGGADAARLPVDCLEGCTLEKVTLERTDGDADLPFVLDRLDLGGTDLLDRSWAGGDERATPVAGGLLATTGDTRLSAVPAHGSDDVPVMVTRTATWDGDPVLESPGGEDLPASVVATFPALPLVEGDGVYADLARVLPGSPPTVPAAEVMVLARADTPSAMLAALDDAGAAAPRSIDQVEREVRVTTGAAQARVYGLMAGFCVVAAFLVLLTAVARERPGWLRDVAALRVVGVTRDRVRRSTVVEVLWLLLVAAGASLLGCWAAVSLLLGDLALVQVPLHAVPLRTGVTTGPLLALTAVVAVLVAVVVGRGRAAGAVDSRPAILREAGR